MITWHEDGGFFESEQPVHFPVFRQSIKVLAYTEAETTPVKGKLAATQISAVEHLASLSSEWRSNWSELVFDEFSSSVESGDCELEDDELPSRCRTPEDVWGFIRWNEVVAPEQGPNGDRFILVQGTPGWRIEHGLQLLLKNGQLLWVGRADIAIFMTGGWAQDYLPSLLWGM